MGDIADQIIDSMIDEWAFNGGHRKRKTFQRRTGQRMWRTADGSVIAMESMSTSHIMNAMNLCEEMGNTGKFNDLQDTLRERQQQERLDD